MNIHVLRTRKLKISINICAIQQEKYTKENKVRHLLYAFQLIDSRTLCYVCTKKVISVMQINSVYVIGRLLVRPFQVSSMFSVHKRIGFMKHKTNKKTQTYMQVPIKQPCTLCVLKYVHYRIFDLLCFTIWTKDWNFCMKKILKWYILLVY